MKILFFLVSTTLIFNCGPQHVQDPNANVLVTWQYENGPEIIVLQDDCKPQLDCTNKSEAECAVALYHDSDKFIKDGEKLITKKLYLSAQLEFIQAMCRLVEAEIRLEKAKTTNYQDYKIVMHFKLEQKVKQKIKYCERLVRFTEQQR